MKGVSGQKSTVSRAGVWSKSERSLSLVADIVAVGPRAVSLAIAGVAWTSGLPTAIQWSALVAVAMSLGVAAGLSISWLLHRARPSNGYRVISIDQTYQFDEENPRIQRQVARTVIRAARPGVFLFIDRTHWSGTKAPLLSSPQPGQERWEVPHSFEGWHNYVVALARPLTRGETVTALTEIPRFCSSKFPTLGRSAA